jgi:predicted small lipoprotein YifL
MRLLSIVLAASLMLAGCGSKGPLYLPEQKYPQPEQESK